jgi:hypothetical protein
MFSPSSAAIPDKDEVVGSNPIGPTYENASKYPLIRWFRGVFRFPSRQTKADQNRRTSTVSGVVTGVRSAPFPRLARSSLPTASLPLWSLPLALPAALACALVLVVGLPVAGVIAAVRKAVGR